MLLASIFNAGQFQKERADAVLCCSSFNSHLSPVGSRSEVQEEFSAAYAGRRENRDMEDMSRDVCVSIRRSAIFVVNKKLLN